MNVKSNTIFIAQFALLLAIEAIVCFTPLGSLPVGPMIVATLSHLPVIMAAILLGTRMGALMGFFFGLFSFLVWTFAPPAPVAFLFTPFHSVGEHMGNWGSLVVCFLPRILIGVVAGESHRLISKVSSLKPIAGGIGGVLGALTNTVFVLGGIFVFFGTDLFIAIAAGVVSINGLLELILGGIAGLACLPIMMAIKRGH